jgi:hypothetical protein
MNIVYKYALYLGRWQLSTPILAVFVVLFNAALGATVTTILANLVGGLIFFWVDRWIFSRTTILSPDKELWETQANTVCYDCRRPIDRGYRLVKKYNYDKTHDNEPQFRCQACSRIKYEADHKGG